MANQLHIILKQNRKDLVGYLASVATNLHWIVRTDQWSIKGIQANYMKGTPQSIKCELKVAQSLEQQKVNRAYNAVMQATTKTRLISNVRILIRGLNAYIVALDIEIKELELGSSLKLVVNNKELSAKAVQTEADKELQISLNAAAAAIKADNIRKRGHNGIIITACKDGVLLRGTTANLTIKITEFVALPINEIILDYLAYATEQLAANSWKKNTVAALKFNFQIQACKSLLIDLKNMVETNV